LTSPKGFEKVRHSRKFYALLLLYLAIAACIFINILNLHIPFWPFSLINPTPEAVTQSRSLDYPPYLFFNFRGSEIVTIILYLIPRAPLAVDVSAELSASGNLNTSYLGSISTVFVGFVGSSPSAASQNLIITLIGVQFPFVALHPIIPYIYYYNGIRMSGSNQEIVWHNAGDYAPIIVLLFNNGTTISQTYPYLSVHVDPMEAARMEQYNRVNEALSVALVLFGFVEGYKILYDIDKPNNLLCESKNAPNTANRPSKRAKKTK